jgi:hypothetical protein
MIQSSGSGVYRGIYGNRNSSSAGYAGLFPLSADDVYVPGLSCTSWRRWSEKYLGVSPTTNTQALSSQQRQQRWQPLTAIITVLYCYLLQQCSTVTPPQPNTSRWTFFSCLGSSSFGDIRPVSGWYPPHGGSGHWHLTPMAGGGTRI